MAEMLKTNASSGGGVVYPEYRLDKPSDVNLYLRTLRILDLDLLPDWPDANSQTFRPGRDAHLQQKGRVRTAEWILYRLFEIWDSQEAKTKLGPFFPALEPIQSIKLRAALFQLLNTLKQSGFLGRDFVVRKSMLDDCRGEKFEEMLFIFSTAVLRKVVNQDKRTRKQATYAKQPVFEHVVTNPDTATMIALELACSVSIANSLNDREQHRSRIRTLESQIAQEETRIESRAVHAQSSLDAHMKRMSSIGVDAATLKEHLQQEFEGDHTWHRFVLSGDQEGDRHMFLEDDFESIWRQAKQGQAPSYDDVSRGLLVDLSKRVTEQRSRLETWKSFQHEVSTRNETQISQRSPMKSPVKSSVKRSRNFTSNPSTRSPIKRPIKNAMTSPTKSPVKRSTQQSKDSRGSTSRRIVPSVSTSASRVASQNLLACVEQGSPKNPPTPLEFGEGFMGKATANTDMVPDVMPASPSKTCVDRNGSKLPDICESHSSQDGSSEHPNVLRKTAFDSNHIRHKSLAERTRQSIALATSSVLPEEDISSGTFEAALQQESSESKQNNNPSLADRAQHSMAQSLQQLNAKPKGHQKSKSMFAKPVDGTGNPFHSFVATPDARLTRAANNPATRPTSSPNPSTPTPTPMTRHEHEGGDGTKTPPELLFSEDADCASVFKTRSKMRFSPPGTPLSSSQDDDNH